MQLRPVRKLLRKGIDEAMLGRNCIQWYRCSKGANGSRHQNVRDAMWEDYWAVGTHHALPASY
jgi:hypothetical protein